MLTREAERILHLQLKAAGNRLLLIVSDAGTFVHVAGRTFGEEDVAVSRAYVGAVEELLEAGCLRQMDRQAFDLTSRGVAVANALVAEEQAEQALPDSCRLRIGEKTYVVSFLGANMDALPQDEYKIRPVGAQVGPGLYLGHTGFFGIKEGDEERGVAVLCRLPTLACLEGRETISADELKTLFKRPGLRSVREHLLGKLPTDRNGVLPYPTRFMTEEIQDPGSIAAFVDAVDDARRQILADCERDVLMQAHEARQQRRPEGITAAEVVAWPEKRRFYAAREHVRWTFEDLVAKELLQTNDGVHYEVRIRRLSEIRRVIAGLPSEQLLDVEPPGQQAAYVPQSSGEFDAFLCHASEDRTAIVEPFAEAMEQRGLKPWLDKGQVQWGDNLVKKVQDGLARSRYVLVFLSQAFLSKPWPETELHTALSMEIGGRQLVLPLLLGLTHDELQARYPMVSAKLYKNIPAYDPTVPVDASVVERLVEEFKSLKG